MRKLFLVLIPIFITSCSKDDIQSISSKDIIGSWYGTFTYENPASGTKYQYLTMQFNEDETGEFEYKGPTQCTVASFNYSINGHTVKCEGYECQIGGEVKDFNMSLKYEGDRLIPVNKLTKFILTRDGSIITDQNGIVGETDPEDELDSISAPTLDRTFTRNVYDGFSIFARFNNNGDLSSNMYCTIYWRAYSGRQSETPSIEDLTKIEQMRSYDSTTKSTTFNIEHAGYNGGTYIYYCVQCSNRKGSCLSDVTFTVVPRL